MNTALEKRSSLLMAMPTLVILTIFSVLPFFYIIALSLSRSTLVRPLQDFIWLANYKRAVSDEIFRTSIVNTLVFAFGVTFIETVLGFILAVLLRGGLAACSVLLTISLLPRVTRPVAVASVWRLIYDPVSGLLNHYGRAWGLISQTVAFLGRPDLALPSIMVVDIWEWTPFVFLLSLAVLVSLPTEPYEAAAVDGASRWQMFRHITLPLTAPAVIVIAIIRLIGAFKVFDLVFILTFGGPGSATQVASFYIYKIGFTQFKSGYASALTVVLLIVVAVIITLLTVFRDRIRARYEE